MMTIGARRRTHLEATDATGPRRARRVRSLDDRGRRLVGGTFHERTAGPRLPERCVKLRELRAPRDAELFGVDLRPRESRSALDDRGRRVPRCRDRHHDHDVEDQ
jgi:hypothetical protein